MSKPLEDIFFGDNAAYIEQIQERIAADPQSVGDSWRALFADVAAGEINHRQLIEEIAARARRAPVGNGTAATSAGGNIDAAKQGAVNNLILQYRLLGAREANINPLEYERQPSLHLLPESYGLTDLECRYRTDIPGMETAILGEIIAKLKTVYCGTMVPEFMHISDAAQRSWLLKRFESPRPLLREDEKKRLLERLIAAESLEQYLHKRYVGQKRFSLEGGDSLIPLLDVVLRTACKNNVQETVIGMAHRGRLNVLINILGKQPSDLFMEFEGKHDKISGSGDVKYHLGFSSTLKAHGHQMHLALAFNPSHLEIVGPVVQGSVRARQDRRKDGQRKSVLPVHIHGDAAFAGQGVVMETLNFSQAHGYKTGGALHIIVNNQIGFTTSTPHDARSTFFCTDIGKMVEIPIIHVNCDDLAGLVYAAQTAFDFRQTFGVDVIIDLICFRRHGHNEQDEPLMTQPLMYQKIKQHPGTTARFGGQLIAEKVVTEGEIREMTKAYQETLARGLSASPDAVPTETSAFTDWGLYRQERKKWDWQPADALPVKALAALGEKLATLPPDFTPHPQLKRLLAQRQEMAAGKLPLNWGMAEMLSYATLLEAGVHVRLSGQDCGRGTFSHRHAVWHDQKRDKRDGGNYVPLRHLSGKQADFLVIDSILSEAGVLGFEYGYATTNPETLVIWEAQFGDFANGAQVVIDQFIAAGESKWGRYCGLVMFLPHGYEGQGPEHSSARVERYLQLCAEYNIQVCVPSSPAQIYHLLRRQMLRRMRQPLIVITPKSLLRHPEAVSSLEELAGGQFEPVISETDADIKPGKVRRLVFCAGKIYYELRAARRERKQTNVAVCRLEQLYPFPHTYVRQEIEKYPAVKEVVWCQEEPGNQGAWHRIQHYLRRQIGAKQHLTYALRPSSASTATGYSDLHKSQQKEVIEAALDINSTV